MTKVTPDDSRDDGTSVTDSTSVSGNMVLAGLGKNDGKLVNVYLLLIPFAFYSGRNIGNTILPRFCDVTSETFIHYRCF